MSGPLAPSPLADTAALASWLERALGAGELQIDSSSAPPLNGASNDTMMLRARWREGGLERAGGFVIRRPPTGESLYHRYDLAGQYATMQALTGTGVPVPPLVGYEPDPGVLGSPFYVMREVAGDAPPDLPPYTQVGWVLGLTQAEQSHLYAASIAELARIHRLDIAGLELGHLGPGSGCYGFHEQLESARRWYEWAVTGQPNPVLDATLQWLLDQEPAPADRLDDGLNWGDARVGNMLYVDLEPVCVLDWEMAAIGPPEVDLGWWLFMNRFHSVGMENPTLPGFPDDATTVAMWEDAVGRTARDVSYYDVFGGFRFGIIVLRAARRMVDSGQLPPDQSFERVNGATMLLADILGLPDPA